MKDWESKWKIAKGIDSINCYYVGKGHNDFADEIHLVSSPFEEGYEIVAVNNLNRTKIRFKYKNFATAERELMKLLKENAVDRKKIKPKPLNPFGYWEEL